MTARPWSPVILILCLLAPVPAFASTREKMMAVNHLIWDSGKFKQSYSTVERRQFATALFGYWSSFEERIPRLTPNETVWVMGEINSNSTERYVAVLNRRGGALHAALEKVSGCKIAYEQLIADVGGNEKREALRWVRTVNCYNSDLKENLVAVGLINKSAGLEDPFHMALFSLWPQRIIGPVLGSVLDEPNFR